VAQKSTQESRKFRLVLQCKKSNNRGLSELFFQCVYLFFGPLCTLFKIGVVTGTCHESDLHSILIKQGNISGRLLKKLPVLAFARLNVSEHLLAVFSDDMAI
jgi:hypothetical protein